MKLEEHLKHQPPEVREAVSTRLSTLAQYHGPTEAGEPGAHSRMQLYIYSDFRILPAIWEALCDELQSCEDEAVEVMHAIKRWARTNDFVLAIPIVGIHADCVYAHFVPFDTFCKWLIEIALDILDEDEIRHWLEDVMGLAHATQQAQRLRGLRLREFTMWATFHETEQGGDPFDYLPAEPRAICASLGLCKADAEQELLAFRYKLPKGTLPCFPTVLAVAAGGAWSERWMHAPSQDDRWGMTQPWEEWPGAHSCPEVVHAPVDGSMVAMPVVKLDPR